MPNIIIPKKRLSTGTPKNLPITQENEVGVVKSKIKKIIAIIPKYLPIRAQTCFIKAILSIYLVCTGKKNYDSSDEVVTKSCKQYGLIIGTVFIIINKLWLLFCYDFKV